MCTAAGSRWTWGRWAGGVLAARRLRLLAGPGVFAGVPSAQDLVVRDELIAAQVNHAGFGRDCFCWVTAGVAVVLLW